jgi:hypothetical protein
LLLCNYLLLLLRLLPPDMVTLLLLHGMRLVSMPVCCLLRWPRRAERRLTACLPLHGC